MTMDPVTRPTPKEPAAAPRKRGWLDISRKRAFVTHLCISATIVSAACALIFLFWYPDPYFQAIGTWNVLRVLIGVDLVLGPLLTLILFKPGKWGLKFDVACIALVQLTALVYGLTVIYQERPYFTVFAVDRFTVLAFQDVDGEQWREARASGRIDAKPSYGPLLVAAIRPEGEQYQRLIDETLFEGKPDIDRRPEFWSRYEDQTAQVADRQHSLAELKAARPDAAARIAALPRKLGLPEERLGFTPMNAKNRDVTAVVDAETGELLDVIDVDPWIG